MSRPEEPPHGLRFRVYRVDPATGERTVPDERFVLASKTAPPAAAWPPCKCPRCRP